MGDALSEFFAYTHDCVWDAVLMAAHHLNATAWPLDGAHLDTLTREAVSYNETTDREGAATLNNLTAMLDRWRISYRVVAGYSNTEIGDALGGLLDQALSRGKPVVLGLDNGQALSGDERGLQGHCIAVLREAPGGYACGDGDNPLCITQGLAVVYSLAELVAAGAQSATVLEAVPGVFSPMATMPGAGWNDNGQTLMAPNQVPVVLGFREWVLSHPWAEDNTPLAPEYGVTTGSIEYGDAAAGPGTRQDFRFCSLGYTQAWGVYVIATGQDIAALVAEVASLNKQLAAGATPDPKYLAAYKALALLKAAEGLI